MGILKRMQLKWKSMTTEQKISTVIDVITGFGSSVGSMAVAARIGAGQNRLSKACINITAAGLGLCAADVASKELQENYGKPLAAAIDRAKERADEVKKEAVADE